MRYWIKSDIEQLCSRVYNALHHSLTTEHMGTRLKISGLDKSVIKNKNFKLLTDSSVFEVVCGPVCA